MSETYKHAFSITSQIYFCSTPIRLDSYNRCQFGCVYCFSRDRAIKHSGRGVREANAAAIERRFHRVREGNIASALDEFLQRRVPIQLGGMQDPFSPFEADRRVTFRILSVLRDFEYPTLLSTKGSLASSDSYVAILREMNVSVRFSAAAIEENARPAIESGCNSFSETLACAESLARAGIPVTLRIQPIIPGFEDAALRMMTEAASAGVRHVSLEYLKLPVESRNRVAREIMSATGIDVLSIMSDQGVLRVGPDFTLATLPKLRFLTKARTLAKRLGLTVGAGDTELIHLSDGGGCCNGASMMLRESNIFTGNLTGVLKGAADGQRISFSDFMSHWTPGAPINPYLMTDSRTRREDAGLSDWQNLVAHRWNGGKGPYSPAFFAGVRKTAEVDASGFAIYEYRQPGTGEHWDD